MPHKPKNASLITIKVFLSIREETFIEFDDTVGRNRSESSLGAVIRPL